MTNSTPVVLANELPWKIHLPEKAEDAHMTKVPLHVDYDRSVEEIVSMKGSWTSKHFPPAKSGKEDVEAVLVYLAGKFPTASVLAELEKLGLQAANAHQFLAFSVLSEDEELVEVDGTNYCVTALGQSYTRDQPTAPDDEQYFDEIGVDETWRFFPCWWMEGWGPYEINGVSPEYEWDHAVFLAVPKSG